MAKKAAKKKPKGTPIGKLKKKLDSIFSKYIRAKYSAQCYTCGQRKLRKNLQCGHFVSRAYLATRWDENNCRPQCSGCNIWGRGQLLDFEENLIEELGLEIVQGLKKKRNEVWNLKAAWYEEQILIFSEKLKSYG